MGSLYRGLLGRSAHNVRDVAYYEQNQLPTRSSLFDCTEMASKGVDSGSGSSIASGRFVLIEGCEGLRIKVGRVVGVEGGLLL